jgi:hypothetical protein
MVMRANPDFILRQVAGRYLLAPVGSAADNFSGMITINETGKFLWEKLYQEQTVDSLAQILVDTYGIDIKRAKKDVVKFLDPIRDTGAIIE